MAAMLRWCLLLVCLARSLCFVTVRGPSSALSSAAWAPPARRMRAVTAVEMNMAGRFLRVAKANINSVLQRWEDPEKVLDQTVDDMNKDLIKVRQSYAEVSATQKRLQKQKEQATALADEWYSRAQLALSKDDDELAREALTRRQQQVDTADSLGAQLDAQTEAVTRLYDAMGQLEARISEARSNKEQLIARARTAKTATKVSDMLNSVGDGNSVGVFDRMVEKVENMEAEAEVTRELAGTSSGSLEQKFARLEGSSKVEDELAKMKGALGGSSSSKALPSKVDDELEQMKKKASEA